MDHPYWPIDPIRGVNLGPRLGDFVIFCRVFDDVHHNISPIWCVFDDVELDSGSKFSKVLQHMSHDRHLRC